MWLGGAQSRAQVLELRACAFCASFAAQFSGARFSAFTSCFWKTKRHVSKCEFSIFMTLVPNTLVVLGQAWRFQCKRCSQADCTPMHSGGPPSETSGSPWLRESLSTHFRQVPHPALLVRFRQSRGSVRSELSGLSTPRGQDPSPFTPSPA